MVLLLTATCSQGDGFRTSNEQYSPGVLLWYSNTAFDDNNTTEHPGGGFNLVVDVIKIPFIVAQVVLHLLIRPYKCAMRHLVYISKVQV
ncbi:hypothetical protein ACOBV9_21025 (plasmid) [Pseudoalteromonas espejiana]